MVDHLCAAIGASRQTIMAEYDPRTDEALSRLASTLPTATALELLAKLDEAYAESHLLWQNVLSGSEPAMRDQPRPAPRHARGITPDDGDGDDEHPHTRKRTKVQGIITAYVDSGVREGLLQMHEGKGSWAARTRLAELSDPNVDHTWLWRLNPRHGPTLDADEYIDSVRFRLGCAGPTEPVTCAAFNSGSLDTGAAHASCCALGEATRGHNAVSSLIHAAAQQCDHTSEMEVPGLIPGTDLRPADVLTSALGNAYTALDVSICSPHALEAGTDCTQSRVEAKLEHYGTHLAALLRQNISYIPIVWSAYGRPHQDTLTVLRSLSKSIARKRNFASATRPWLTRATLWLARDCPGGSCQPFRGSCQFAPLPCEFSWGSDLTLSASPARVSVLSASVLTWSGTSRLLRTWTLVFESVAAIFR